MTYPDNQTGRPVAEAPLSLSLAGLIRSWSHFWFHPADPTTLGFIRICCGILVLYVHLLYSYDLQALFGTRAWVDLKTVTDYRHNIPTPVQPDSWEDNLPRPLFEAFPDPMDRLQILESLADDLAGDLTKLPAGDQERLQVLERAYIDYLDENSIDPRTLPRNNPEEKQRIIEYARRYGVDPRLVYAKGTAAWSLWFHLTDPTWMAIAHGCILVIMLLFTLGFCTRVTAVLTWLAAVSYIQRSPPTLFGQDTMMNVLLLYLMVGPSGAALSVDRLLARTWARRRGLTMSEEPERSVGANFTIRLIQINLCFIYLASGLSKLLGTTWWGGTAVWYTLANYSFAPLNNRLYRSFLKFLTDHRPLWETFMNVGVLHTFAVEIGFPFLAWNRRLRWVMVILATILHTMIAVFMGLTVFQLFMLVLLLSFFPPATIKRLVEPLAASLRRRIPALAGAGADVKKELALSES